MSGYLQRLLDRAAIGAAPTLALSGGRDALPSALSQSPLAAADQRFGDPGFADRDAGEGEDWGAPVQTDAPMQTARSDSSVEQPVAKDPVEPVAFRDPVETVPVADPATTQAAAPIEQAPEVAEPTLATVHPMPVGHVSTEDLVLPEPPEAALPVPGDTTEVEQTKDSGNRSEVQPVIPPEPELRADFVTQQTETPDAPVTPAVAEATVADMPKALPAEQGPPQELFRLDPQVEPPTTPEPTQSQPDPIQIAEPPKLVVPDLPEPDPAPAPAPQTATTPPPPQPANTASEPAPAPTPTQPRNNRPMTAAEASIIGPLPTRRRALTLFGNRRR